MPDRLSERVQRRTARLLELARTALPFAAGLVAWRDPVTDRYAPLGSFGYRPELMRFLITDFVEHDPGFSAVARHPERTLFWADVPNFATSTTARTVLVPGGYREGTSLILDREGIALGVAHLSLATPEIPDHARTFLNALRSELADVVTDAYACTEGSATDLTCRELEVLRLVAAGLTNQQIARRLAISASTVSTHLERIHRKLDVTSRVAAATTALRQGLID